MTLDPGAMVHGRLPVRPLRFDLSGTLWQDRPTISEAHPRCARASRDWEWEPQPEDVRQVSGQIFVSYSWTDAVFVQQLSTYLAQEEIPPWVDNQLEYGELWEQVIVERIRRCMVFLVVMSGHARQSHFVNAEIKLALEQKKTLIPILRSGDPFHELAGFQF